MSQTVLYITSNPMKRRTVERFIRQHVPNFKIAAREVAFYEPQTLFESDVIAYKALEAWKIFRRPLIVDDAGFYLDEYEGFPGPLAKPIAISLGWEGMLKLAAPTYRARVYCRLGYVDHKGLLHHYRGETAGTLDRTIGTSMVDKRGIYALLRPDNSSMTIAEMVGTELADVYSPRARALRAFVKNVFADLVTIPEETEDPAIVGALESIESVTTDLSSSIGEDVGPVISLEEETNNEGTDDFKP